MFKTAAMGKAANNVFVFIIRPNVELTYPEDCFTLRIKVEKSRTSATGKIIMKPESLTNS